MPRSLPVAAAVVAAVVAALCVSGPAPAQPQCAPRDALLEELESAYGEVPAGSGVIHDGALLEIVMTPDGATWSMVLTSPGGSSCLVATGEGWRWRAPRQEEPET